MLMVQQGDGAIHGRQNLIIQARSVYRQHNGNGRPLCTKIDARAERPARLGQEAASLQTPPHPTQVTESQHDAVLRAVVSHQLSCQPGNARDRSRGLIWEYRLPSARRNEPVFERHLPKPAPQLRQGLGRYARPDQLTCPAQSVVERLHRLVGTCRRNNLTPIDRIPVSAARLADVA